MKKENTKISSLEDIDDFVAKPITFNEKDDLPLYIYGRVFPLILSALVTIYSVLTASIYFDLSHFVHEVINLVLLFGSIFTVFSLFMMILQNSETLVGLEVSKVNFNNEYISTNDVGYRFSPVFKSKRIKGLKKTLNDLTGTAFVIFLPAGIVDVVLGLAANDPQLGINTTSEIIIGTVLLAISVILLVLTIRQEKNNIKKLKDVETEKMRNLLKKIHEQLRTENHARIILDDSDQWSLSSP